MFHFNYRDISFQLSRYSVSIIAIFQFDYRDISLHPSERVGKNVRKKAFACYFGAKKRLFRLEEPNLKTL